jgi:hypothetical protein
MNNPGSKPRIKPGIFVGVNERGRMQENALTCFSSKVSGFDLARDRRTEHNKVRIFREPAGKRANNHGMKGAGFAEGIALESSRKPAVMMLCHTEKPTC